MSLTWWQFLGVLLCSLSLWRRLWWSLILSMTLRRFRRARRFSLTLLRWLWTVARILVRMVRPVRRSFAPRRILALTLPFHATSTHDVADYMVAIAPWNLTKCTLEEEAVGSAWGALRGRIPFASVQTECS